MAVVETKHVALAGISACVPKAVEDNYEVYKQWGDATQFVATTGVRHKRRAADDVTASDLALAAAEKLITELGWERDSIDALVNVTQSPDYLVPATACILQDRLHLPQSCLTLDVSLGCSGWVYGMSALASIMECGRIRRALLLCSDTPLKTCSPRDKSTYPLFGDAAACTALERTDDVRPMTFALHTDGSGYDAIIMRESGMRHIPTPASFEERDYDEGIRHTPMQTAMDGISVFTFGISKAPKVVREVLELTGETVEQIDCFAFHQANLFMNEKIRKKLRLTPEQVPYCMDEFGNTSSVSIPLALVTRRAEALRTQCMKHVGCGFGVGLSWGAVRFDTDHIVVPSLVEL